MRKCELGLKRYKTVENISDEDMDKAVEEQEVEFGRARGDAVAGGEGHDHAWKDLVEDGMPMAGWQERMYAAMGRAQRPDADARDEVEPHGEG